MYLLLTLLILAAVWLLLAETVFRGSFFSFSRFWRKSSVEGSAAERVDVWPLVVAAAMVGLAGLVDELLLPGPFRWLSFHPAAAAQLARAARWQHLLALAPSLALLVSRRKKLRGSDAAVALALWMVTNAALIALLQINTRIDYPFDLEWMEGTMVDHTVMLRRGGALYQEPSPQYIPYLYGPLYHRIVALLPYVQRSPYLPGRMVSLVATGITTLLLFGVVARSARDSWLGLLAALALPASYSFVGHWHDIHRVDSLFVCLTLLGVAVAVSGLPSTTSRKRLIAAGLCFALAVFTKQAAGLVAFVVTVWVLLNRGWRAAAWLALAGVAGSALLLLLELWSSGSVFFQYVLYLPTKIREPNWVFFRVQVVDSDLIALPGLILLFFLFDGALTRSRKEGWRALYRDPTVAVTVILIAISVFMRVKPGGYSNCRLPFVVGGLLALGLWLREHCNDWARLGTAALLLTVYTAFMDPFMEHGKGVIPSEKDLRAQRDIEDYLRGRPGEVLAVCHSHLSYSAKRQLSFHEMAVTDWTMAFGYPKSIAKAIEDRRWSTVVLDRPDLPQAPPDLQRTFVRGYHCVWNRFRWDRDTGFNAVGVRTRPELVCERRDDRSKQTP